ncbi:hypothetical protein LHO93_004594, partial [Vibrio parahaemolyticus]|nr:hypothetical protein [Vibrio parahaemolyticus]
VIVGYTNTESLLYSLCGDITLTVGAFENTRIFSLDKFIISDEAMRGPKPRIYLPKLLNWVNFEQAKLIKEYSPHVWKEIYTPTSYSENALSITKELTFQNPQLYKHYFISFSEQLKLLSVLNIEQRHTKLKQWINEAIQYHQMIKNIPLDLEKHGNGEHLDHWLNTINIYKSKHI